MKEEYPSEVIVRYVAVISALVSAGGAWGSLVGFIAKSVFDLTENDMWLFVVLPFMVLFAILMWKKMPGILGYE